MTVHLSINHNPQNGTERYAFEPADLSQWGSPVPERRFLLEYLLPMGAVSLLTTVGHLAPLPVLMHLALQVSADDVQKTVLGPTVTEQGAAVVFSTTHDKDEIHWVLHQLRSATAQDFDGPQSQRIRLVPLRQVAEGMPFIIKRTVEGHYAASELFVQLLEQLKTIPDLTCVIFDDIFGLLPEGRRSKEYVLYFAMGQLARIASETGASVIVGDNISCASSKNGYVDAIDQITSVVDNNTSLYRMARCVYALWETQNKQYQGAMIKNNYGPSNRTMRHYRVSPEGLLMRNNSV